MKNDKMESGKIETDEQRRRILVHAQNKIPVYIGYFTAWVDADGFISMKMSIKRRSISILIV
jgi:murein L,D-transpeptidase YcbB/YkuD